MKSYLYLFFSILLFTSCSSSESAIEDTIFDYSALNETEIQDYISINNLNPEKSSSGLYYIITNEGVGNTPDDSSIVQVYYKGYFSDNTIFQETETAGVELEMESLILGFKEGLKYLKEGGEATFIIPSKLAYENLGNFNGSIPPGKVLLFDVKLISVN